MPKGDHLQPNIATMNPAMQVPFAESSEGKILPDSRQILHYANGGAATEEVEAIVTAIYGTSVDSLAILTAAGHICLMGCVVRSGVGKGKLLA